MKIKIAVVKPMFLLAARADADVDLYADLLLDRFTDDEIAKYINAPDWKAEFLKLMPEAAELMPWFERLRTAVLALLTEPPPESTIAAGGNKNGSGNAGT